MKAVATVMGQVFGLVLGSNFTSPADEAMVKYGHLRLLG